MDITWDDIIALANKHPNRRIEVIKDGRRYEAVIVGIVKKTKTIMLKVRETTVIQDDCRLEKQPNRPMFLSKKLKPILLSLGIITMGDYTTASYTIWLS